MKIKRTLIYINADFKQNNFVYTGINFTDFIEFLSAPMKNIMTLMGGSNVILLESKFERGLELFEGREMIQRLAKEDIYSLGNFCFVDYAELNKTSEVNEEQIAELLYLGHMFKPLKSPFFDVIGNRFAYLSHDDGFFCKLYCRNMGDFNSILAGKIVNTGFECHKVTITPPDPKVCIELLKLAEYGLLIDMNEMDITKNQMTICVYVVGKIQDMDIVYNQTTKLKDCMIERRILIFKDNKWNLI